MMVCLVPPVISKLTFVCFLLYSSCCTERMTDEVTNAIMMQKGDWRRDQGGAERYVEVEARAHLIN